MLAIAMEKMGIMATGCGVHIVVAMATEKIEFLSFLLPFPTQCERTLTVSLTRDKSQFFMALVG